jgi:hypothetical protein
MSYYKEAVIQTCTYIYFSSMNPFTKSCALFLLSLQLCIHIELNGEASNNLQRSDAREPNGEVQVYKSSAIPYTA